MACSAQPCQATLRARAPPSACNGGTLTSTREGTIAVRRRLVLVPYAAVVAAAFVAFVRWYEEPTLAWQFGDRYQAYRAAVPGWWPRRHPWRPAGDD